LRRILESTTRVEGLAKPVSLLADTALGGAGISSQASDTITNCSLWRHGLISGGRGSIAACLGWRSTWKLQGTLTLPTQESMSSVKAQLFIQAPRTRRLPGRKRGSMAAGRQHCGGPASRAEARRRLPETVGRLLVRNLTTVSRDRALQVESSAGTALVRPPL
jgi:hypothetical protein